LLGWFYDRCRRKSNVGQLPFLHQALAFGTNCQPEILRHRRLVELEAPDRGSHQPSSTSPADT
jgi:hypothetical protein